MFTESEGWGRKFSIQMMKTSITLHSKGGNIVPKDHTKRMEELQDLALEYGPAKTNNMDETGLFYKFLSNRGYVDLEKKRSVRGSKQMNQKSRVTIYICTNAGRSGKVSLDMIDHTENPRCFKTKGQKLAYFQPKKHGLTEVYSSNG